MNDNSIKIVVCDDHTLYRQGIKYVLASKQDVEVIGEAEDGLKLLKLLKHVTPDIILLDINMPVMDGTVTLPEIKKQYPNVKVIVVSMQNGPEMIEIMMSRGADGYLTKNDDTELIYTAIRECHENGRYIDKRIQDVLLNNMRKNPPKEQPAIPTPVPEPEEPPFVDSDIVEPEAKSSWYRMPLRAVLIGIGIAVSVFVGLYVYNKVVGAKTAYNRLKAEPSYRPKSEFPYAGDNTIETVFSK
jgi:DNA-binding NarL/FixJ family response regulator